MKDLTASLGRDTTARHTVTLNAEEVERLHCLLQEASGRLAELGSIFDPVLASRVSRAETALDRARQLILGETFEGQIRSLERLERPVVKRPSSEPQSVELSGVAHLRAH
jgi:hypothetical protein